jgi:hypothetical protein
MSVYYEAVKSGRLKVVGWSPAAAPGRHGRPTGLSCAGIRRALREAKRLEAEERNEATPHERTKKHRREIDAAAVRVAGKRAGRG